MLLIDLENPRSVKQGTNCRKQRENINEGFLAVLFLEELHDLGYLDFLHWYPRGTWVYCSVTSPCLGTMLQSSTFTMVALGL